MNIDLRPLFLIAIGTTILVVAAWLLYQYRKQLTLTQALIQLNESLQYDLPNFLRECWPLLQQSGFMGFTWDLNWFGTKLSGNYGSEQGDALAKTFEVQEITLQISLFHPKQKGERKYFSLAQAENFFLLVRMNLWIKVGSVQRAFEQTARMTVFIKHDVKNMVQLLSLSAEQLHNTKAGDEARLLSMLRASVPAVLDRAEHMLRRLNEPTARTRTASESQQPPAVALASILQQTAALYDLPVSIEGEACLHTDKDRLLSIVDNLLGNYSRLGRIQNQRPALVIAIQLQDQQVLTTIEDTQGSPFSWPERLFEPFWSEHGEGRGIGLYQARQQANAAGGDLYAKAPADGPLKFCLVLPITV